MKKSIAPTILSLIAVAFIFTGCAMLGKEKPKPVKKPVSSAAYKTKALAYEKDRNLTKALEYWQIAASIDPSDSKIKGKLKLLTLINQTAAKNHFEKGVKHYKNRQFDKAKKEFLIALRHQPNHPRALNYLQTKFTRQAFRTYQVRQGDTYNRIAARVYQDAGKGFLIASVNKRDFNNKPNPGSILMVPHLDNIRGPASESEEESSTEMEEEAPEIDDEGINLKPIVDIEGELDNARNYFIAKNYPRVLPITQTILENDPSNNEAIELKNRAYLAMGKDLMLKKKYTEALNMFNQVDANFEGVQDAIEDLKKQRTREAEEHYRRGVKQFLNEELAKAIEEWEQTLMLNPDHAKARKDIENARNLLEKLQNVE